MNFNNTYAIAALVAGSILLATTMTSNSGSENRTNSDENSNTLISLQNETAITDPKSCSGQDLHKTGAALTMGTQA